MTLRLRSARDVRPPRGTQSARRYIFYFKFGFYLRRLRLPVLSSALLPSSIPLPSSSRLLFISPRFSGRSRSAPVKCKCKINIYAPENERFGGDDIFSPTYSFRTLISFTFAGVFLRPGRTIAVSTSGRIHPREENISSASL